jgi:hypothetical protein
MIETATAPSAQAQEEAQVVEQKTKTAKAKTGNVFLDVAAEIENLTKTKALNMADRLVEDLDSNSFRLGGVLKVIKENGWFEGHASFGAFVSDKYGFQERKAAYLIDIYEHLVTKQIPWEKVQGLGWTKLKDLARYLTPENVDEWVAKAMPLTVSQLQAMLKGHVEGGEGVESAKTTSDVQTMKFKMKNDQIATVQNALAKAKAESGTEHDNAALEFICAGYLGGTVATPKVEADPLKLVKEWGWKKTLEAFGEVFPKVDVQVTPPAGEV